MSKRVSVAILKSAGTNCDRETRFAFSHLGALAELVSIRQLLGKEKSLNDYHILALPGGFTYGDDIAAGKIFANELRLKLADELKRFVADGKLMIGICNGFQILVKAGILPGNFSGAQAQPAHFEQTATLMANDCGKFEDRWVYLKPAGRSVWTKGMDAVLTLPVAHGEGKFVPKDESILSKLKENNQIVLRYCTDSGAHPKFPQNPNGSMDDIAGICDATGRVFGLMPHPERHFFPTQHPSWTRLKEKPKFGDGAPIFQNGINYVKENL